jgi:transposase
MELFTLGIDLGKTTFHLVGMNQRGEVMVRKRFTQTQLLHFTANLKVRLIGMEACGGSHLLGRALREQGHEVRLIAAQYAKPYVKTSENDHIDAEAIAEAVGRPTMRFAGQERRTTGPAVTASGAGTLGYAPDGGGEPDSRSAS